MRIFLALIILILPVQAWAEETSYFDMQIPVMEGAENVEKARSDLAFTLEASYNLKVKDIDEVYDFYDAFFKEQGWKKSFPGSHFGGKWNSASANIGNDGKPIYFAATGWSHKQAPVIAHLHITVTDVVDDSYISEIGIRISPEIFPEQMMDMNETFLADPKNIFILKKALKDTPLDFQATDFPQIDEEFLSYPIVSAYENVMKKLIEEHQEFGAQYVLKTKPVDGRFKSKGFHRAGSEEEDESVPDWVEDFVKEKQQEQKSQTGGKEDPLHKWRRLQEERVEREMKERGCECPDTKKQEQ